MVLHRAKTTYGIIGVKVWMYHGDILPESRVKEAIGDICMLMPKKVKFRKMQKGNMNGKAYSGC